MRSAMHSFAEEIHGFSRSRLKKQSTHVTTVTGKRHVERRGDGESSEIVEIEDERTGFGFVEDKCLDLQVGVVRPFLLLEGRGAGALQRRRVTLHLHCDWLPDAQRRAVI